jgi:hypothetical protein
MHINDENHKLEHTLFWFTHSRKPVALSEPPLMPNKSVYHTSELHGLGMRVWDEYGSLLIISGDDRVPITMLRNRNCRCNSIFKVPNIASAHASIGECFIDHQN